MQLTLAHPVHDAMYNKSTHNNYERVRYKYRLLAWK